MDNLHFRLISYVDKKESPGKEFRFICLDFLHQKLLVYNANCHCQIAIALSKLTIKN